jgi:4-hydroxy-tetrahydrodipicolinate synthase
MTFHGVIPILATPFHDDETLDLDSWTRLVEFMAAVGVNGITILGVLGEANRLRDEERTLLISTAVAVAGGRTPVIVGTSHTGTRVVQEFSRVAQDVGADAVMVTPSKEAVPSDDRIVEMYQRLADGLAIPIVLQDHPASTDVHMSVALMLRLLRSVPGIQCVKEEAVPTAPKVSQLREGFAERPFSILTGLGALYAPFDLEAGSDGFNTGFAFPEVLMAMVQAARASNWQRVHALYSWFAPLIVFEQQPGVAIRKELLRRRGLLSSACARHPGATVTTAVAARLDALLTRTLPGVDVTKPIAVDEIVAQPSVTQL